MSDETADGKRNGTAGDRNDDGAGIVRKLPALSRGERLALADVLVHWTTAVGSMRDVVAEWGQRVGDLRRFGEALDELELDRRIAQGLMIVRQMAATEQLSKTTRIYLRNILGAAANVEFPE